MALAFTNRWQHDIEEAHAPARNSRKHIIIMASATGQLVPKIDKVIRLCRKGCTNRPFYHIVVQKVRTKNSHSSAYKNLYKWLTNSPILTCLHCNVKITVDSWYFTLCGNLEHGHSRWPCHRTSGKLWSNAKQSKWKTSGSEFWSDSALAWPGSWSKWSCCSGWYILAITLYLYQTKLCSHSYLASWIVWFPSQPSKDPHSGLEESFNTTQRD